MQKKAFDKIKHPFVIRTLNNVDIEGIYFNIIKNIYDSPWLTSYLTTES